MSKKLKEFQKFDKFREISINNYLATEEIINEISVAVKMCELAIKDIQHLQKLDCCSFELVGRGVDSISTQLDDLKVWYSCISKGTEFQY